MPRYSQNEREQALSETRKRLLEAAIGEIASKGYAGANINDISKAAGFAKGTIYNYFPSKQELLLEIITEIGSAHIQAMSEAVRGEDDPLRRIERFFEAGFRFVGDHPAQARLLITTLYGSDDTFKKHMYQTYQPMFQLVSAEILLPGLVEGVFRPMDAISTATLIMTIYLGTSSSVDSHGKVWLDPHQVADFVLQSIMTRSGTIHETDKKENINSNRE